MSTTRRAFLKTAALASSAAITGLGARRASAAEPMVFMTPFGFDLTFFDLLNAYSSGHFAREGLDAKVIGANGTAQAIQQVIAGKAQFMVCSALDVVRAIAVKGAPMKVIGTISQGSVFSVVSLKEKPVRSAEELRGKTIGVLSLGGSTESFVDMLLAKAKIPKSEVRILVAGNSPGEVEFIRQGRLDCFLCTLNVVVALERQDAPIEVWSTDRYTPTPGQSYSAGIDTIEHNPALVLKTLRALKASVEQIIAGPLPPLVQRVAQDFEIPGHGDSDATTAIIEAQVNRLWLKEGRANLMRNVPALFQSVATALHDIGDADIPDPSVIYTNRFIDQVMKS